MNNAQAQNTRTYFRSFATRIECHFGARTGVNGHTWQWQREYSWELEQTLYEYT